MKQAIPVEEWAKEKLHPYRSDASAIHQAFSDPSRQDEDSIWWFHHYVCPAGGHLLLQHAYIYECILTHNLQYLQKGLEDGHLDPNARGDVYIYTPHHYTMRQKCGT
jgi:hypothetical protein